MAWEKTKEYILSNLGYPVISVELTEKQLEICIKEACERWFEYRTPIVKYWMFSTIPGIDTYTIPEEVLHQTPQGIKILGVLYQPTQFEQFNYFFQYTLYNYRPIRIANIYMLFMNLSTFKWITGTQPTWELIERNKIKLMPVPQNAITCALIYCINSPESDLDQNLWIWKFSLAKAKQMLGRIRSKFSTLPQPSGDINLDGEKLLEEGKKEEEDLLNELIEKAEPLPIIVG